MVLPSIAHEPNLRYYQNKNLLFEQFIEQDPNLFVDASNNFDRLALMQHYQSLTRMLDITTNPLIALYFSTLKNKECNDCHDGQVYIYQNSINNSNVESDGKILFPELSNQVQQSWRYLRMSFNCVEKFSC